MVDIGLSCTITRSLLGLDGLDLNDHDSYYLAGDNFGRQVSWNRQQVTSPFLDGAVTTYRNRQMVQSQMAIEVMGASPAQVQQRLSDLKAAFSQDEFNVVLAIGGAQWQYECEAADYSEAWTGPRWAANQIQIVFTVPNQPVPLVGGAY